MIKSTNTTIQTIQESDLTPEQRKLASEYRTWTHEATRKEDGARLFTAVTYRGNTTGEWEAVLAHKDGKIERLWGIPRIPRKSKQWELTDYGVMVREDKRD